MTIELYEAPGMDASEAEDSPISNTSGELPEQEPEFRPDDLLGSFDSREEAMAFVQNQLTAQNQVVIDSRVAPFNDYTHVERLTVTIQTNGQSGQDKNYYLVADEGY